MNAILAGVLAVQLFTVPPLTPDQLEQARTAHDNSRVLDEGAFYPLLLNAVEWKEGDETGAMVPDYKAILADPAAARGQLCLIEGYFLRSRPVPALSRPGPWEGRLQEWSISLDDRAQNIIVVYLVAGPQEKSLPRLRQTVRLPARFYKLWDDHDETGRLKHYPVFVGRSARIVRPAAGGVAPEGFPNPVSIAVFVLACSFAVVTLWRYLTHRELERQRLTRVAAGPRGTPGTPAEEEAAAAEGVPLPKDPIKALEELERRRKEEAADEGAGGGGGGA